MKEPTEIIINDKTLQEHLNLHKKWLNEEKGGVRLTLRDANLQHANLRYADLRSANLQDADLQGAGLQNANLQDADLRSAGLRSADLRYDILQDADLRGADLRHANLQYADLQDADLRGADIDFSALPLWCGGLDFNIDERQAKQLVYHVLNIMQHSELNTKMIFKKQTYKWLKNSHLVEKYGLPVLEEEAE